MENREEGTTAGGEGEGCKEDSGRINDADGTRICTICETTYKGRGYKWRTGVGGICGIEEGNKKTGGRGRVGEERRGDYARGEGVHAAGVCRYRSENRGI